MSPFHFDNVTVTFNFTTVQVQQSTETRPLFSPSVLSVRDEILHYTLPPGIKCWCGPDTIDIAKLSSTQYLIQLYVTDKQSIAGKIFNPWKYPLTWCLRRRGLRRGRASLCCSWSSCWRGRGRARPPPPPGSPPPC